MGILFIISNFFIFFLCTPLLLLLSGIVAFSSSFFIKKYISFGNSFAIVFIVFIVSLFLPVGYLIIFAIPILLAMAKACEKSPLPTKGIQVAYFSETIPLFYRQIMVFFFLLSIVALFLGYYWTTIFPTPIGISWVLIPYGILSCALFGVSYWATKIISNRIRVRDSFSIVLIVFYSSMMISHFLTGGHLGVTSSPMPESMPAYSGVEISILPYDRYFNPLFFVLLMAVSSLLTYFISKWLLAPVLRNQKEADALAAREDFSFENSVSNTDENP